jgi:hypothetical protein
MSSRIRSAARSVTLVALASACADPVSPGQRRSLAPVATSFDAGPQGQSHGQKLRPVLGGGGGTVNVTPIPGTTGFAAEITVTVHGLLPNTTYYLQRAADFPLRGQPGVCERALGVAPWGPTQNFVTFPRPNSGPLETIETSDGGAGSAHLTFIAPGIPDALEFDVMFRVVDDPAAPTSELRSECFVVTVK